MLQAALLLLGCALSRYLWEVNITVASVILSVTSFGIFFFIFIVAAGAASENCPYQTPGSHALRFLWSRVQRIHWLGASVVVSAFQRSKVFKTTMKNFEWYHPWWSRNNIKPFLKATVLEVPRAFAIDVYHLGRAMLTTLSTGVCHLGPTMAILLVSLARKVRNRLRGAPSIPGQGLDQNTTALDFRCVSWILQTSLDKAVHLLTLKHLVTTPVLAAFNPTLVADCFDAFIGCIKGVDNHKVVIVQGLEELATVSALCFFNLISHLLVEDPTSSVLEDARQHCLEVLPAYAYFNGQAYYTMNAACCLLVPKWRLLYFQWSDYKPSANEHSMVANSLVKLARFKYQEAPQAKVPRLILRFALHSLSLYPPPPTSIIADCLLIVAIDLGCDIPDVGTMASDERCVCI